MVAAAVVMGAVDGEGRRLEMAAGAGEMSSNNGGGLSLVVTHLLARGSAHIDWCEHNYVISDTIAEFWNCLSNIMFLIMPVILIYLFIPYGNHVSKLVHLIWVMLIAVGLFSAYFHATLSLLGQLLDEVAILWVIIAAYATWFPKQYIPRLLRSTRNDRCYFRIACLVFCIIATMLCMIKPALNPLFLNMFAIPSTILLAIELCRCGSVRIKHLGCRAALLWLVAISCWALDYWYCDTNSSFPYLHCVWHLCITLSAYSSLCVFACLEAIKEVPHLTPRLAYWPLLTGDWGVPYVEFHSGARVGGGGKYV